MCQQKGMVFDGRLYKMIFIRFFYKHNGDILWLVMTF